jgi:MoaA/NifB/PqqE/SkfB family radical SAM enzyme
MEITHIFVMKLTGLHLLLTYQCTFECDHCFTWGSPWQTGTMTLQNIRCILRQARDVGTVEWIFFEGGEPFLYYATLVKAVGEAAGMGFRTGIVTNGYWAQDVEDAREWLKPFAGLIQDLSISSDLYHYDERLSRQVQNACEAARELGIPIGILSIAQPEDTHIASSKGRLPQGESSVMYRGRAADELTRKVRKKGWDTFTRCPHEDLREPGRVHIDAFGNVHICQGISLGNIYREFLSDICGNYDVETHPITGPLLREGPAGLVRHYELPHRRGYADACHLCYEARVALRGRFPNILTPDQMYGVEKKVNP